MVVDSPAAKAIRCGMFAPTTSLTDLSSAFREKDKNSLNEPMMALASQLGRVENKQELLTRIVEHIAEGLEHNPLRFSAIRLPDGLTVVDIRQGMKAAADKDSEGTAAFHQKWAPVSQQFKASVDDQDTLQ